MKYKVIGWTDDELDYPLHEGNRGSLIAAVIKEIREHGYCFGGDAHEFYCPVFNDGTCASWSWRVWGGIMASAWKEEGEYAYMGYYMDELIAKDARKYPEHGVDDSLIVPREELAETVCMHLADEPFAAVKAGTKTIEVRIYDEKRRTLDVGDRIEFRRFGHEDERLLCEIVGLFVENDFESLFGYYADVESSVRTLRYPPESLGGTKRATVRSLTRSMYRYYSKEEERKYGVMAIMIKLL